MFCFPISDHVIVPHGTIPRAYKCISYENWGLKKVGGFLLHDQPRNCWPRLASEKGDPDPAFPLFFFHENPASWTFLMRHLEYLFLSQPVSVPNFGQSRFSGRNLIRYPALYFGEIPDPRIPFQTLQGCLIECCTNIDQFICHVALDKN